MSPARRAVGLALLTALVASGATGLGCGSSTTPDDAAVAGPDAGAGDGSPEGDGGSGPDGGGDGPDYARLFPPDRVVDVDLTFTDEDWAGLLADPMQDVWVHATLTLDGVVVPDVAVRLKGNSSRNSVHQMGSERYSFKVDTNRFVDGQDVLGVDRLNLNNGFKDPSYLRERLGADLYRTMGLPTVRVAHARLTRNGEPFGLYTLVEDVDGDFLREWFPDDEGALYKPEPPAGNLDWRGDSFDDYESNGMDVESDPVTTDHAPLLHFLDVLANTPDGELEAALPEVFDVDGWLRYLAVTIALVNLDYYGAMGHNYLLYEDRSTGRFVFIPWDVNEAYGNFACGLGPDELVAFPYDDPTCGGRGGLGVHPLVTRVLAVAAWRAALEGYLADLLAGAWEPSLVYDEVHELADRIREDVRLDPTAFRSFADFETGLDDDVAPAGAGPALGPVFGLTSFAERRAAALETLLP